MILLPPLRFREMVKLCPWWFSASIVASEILLNGKPQCDHQTTHFFWNKLRQNLNKQAQTLLPAKATEVSIIPWTSMLPRVLLPAA